jgi:hypothetical protein
VLRRVTRPLQKFMLRLLMQLRRKQLLRQMGLRKLASSTHDMFLFINIGC